MKIADYGKAITSYIESPTTAQKLQAKEKAQTLGRTFLAEGSEDIVEPPKSMQVDTTTKGPDLFTLDKFKDCLLYTSPSPRDRQKSRMPSSA